MTKKSIIPKAYLLWIDLEMTGLNPDTDIILEESSYITDFNFETLAESNYRVFHDRERVKKLFDKNEWWKKYPENQKQFLDNLDKGLSLRVIEDQLLEQINKIVKPDDAIYLAGNSIHSDRKFITKYWPTLDQRLHYRMLDVSSFKIIMFHKFGIDYEKENTHRSLIDIQESIDEIKYYLNFFQHE